MGYLELFAGCSVRPSVVGRLLNRQGGQSRPRIGGPGRIPHEELQLSDCSVRPSVVGRLLNRQGGQTRPQTRNPGRIPTEELQTHRNQEGSNLLC